MLLEARGRQELLDHPVSHLLVVPSDRDEGRLNEAALDAHKRGEQLKLALDLVDGLLLVGDDPEHRGEVARADLGEHLEGGLLLLAGDEGLGSASERAGRLCQPVA